MKRIRRPDGLAEQELTHSIIGGFFRVYNKLGYGLRESVYKSALDRELIARGHVVRREVDVPVYYDGVLLGRQRIDRLVDGKVIVETKATEIISPAASRQLFSYLRASGIPIGLLFHFGPKPRFWRLYCPSRKPQ